MNLKSLFLALALSLPFAAAATTVSSIASADPLPAAQSRSPLRSVADQPGARRIDEPLRSPETA